MILDKVKKIGVIITIAILFALFCFSIVDVVIKEPNYNDYCLGYEKAYPTVIQQNVKCESFIDATEQNKIDCNKKRGVIEYDYDASGCPKSFECNTCLALFEDASKGYRLVGFIIMTIMGVIAVIFGMYAKSKDEVLEWLFSGLLIGGITAIFLGTISYFRDMGRFVKPFVLLAEIALIVWVAVRTSRKIMKKK